jgi:hypothetical protein
MFISCKNDSSWDVYELTDSEFGTVLGKMISGVSEIDWYMVLIGVAIIQEYSKRNLNVVANLAVAFAWSNKLYPGWSIQEIIDDNEKWNPLFLPYEEDLQKYLALL